MHSPVDLHELLAQVRDEPSFIQFIEALGVNFASFRRAYGDGAVPNVWQRCATILLAGKFYE